MRFGRAETAHDGGSGPAAGGPVPDPAAGAAAGAAPAKPAYRPEVQGLRAFAVLMVVVYHVWLGRVSGGVDVFLMVSAFLLTVSFLYKVESGRPLRIGHYWLNRAKGLLPAAATALLGVLALTYLLLPPTRWSTVMEQAWASLFYFQNWTLAQEAVDYYAADHSTASPLQHFWSLSIQGQVFVLWPLVIAGAALAWRALRRRRPSLRFRTVLAAAFGAVFAASLAYSVHETATNQAWAYFDTGARLWEFALGSLLAIAAPAADRLPRAVRLALGWAGLAAMLLCGVVLQVERAFPGWIALWPTLAAGAIIVAGRTGSRGGVDRLLSARPLTRLGDMSYALYLWHWPLLVIWLMANDVERPGLLGGLAVIALSLALAWATQRAIEHPLRTWHWPAGGRRRLSVVVAVLVAVVAMPLSGWQAGVAAYETRAQSQTSADNPGARALDPGFRYTGDPDAAVLPLPSQIDDQWSNFGGDCAGEWAVENPVIEHCQEAGDPAAKKTVLVVGDSHAQHWTGALAAAAERNGWHWVLVTKPACRFGGPSETRSPECNEFNAAASDYVLKHRPDAVIALGTLTAFHGKPPAGVPADEERVVPGFSEGIRPFLDAGIQVVAMRDTPRFTFQVPECVSRWGADSDRCSRPTEDLMAPVSPLGELDPQSRPRLSTLDMTDQLCTEGRCRPAIGNILIYFDGSHITRMYAQTTSEVFERRLKAALGW